MDRQEIIKELRTVIGDYLKSQNQDLVDLIYRYEGRDLILRILVDRPEGGITVDECAEVNKQISKLLDEKEILKVGYILEVFSPGLDRPLLVKSDFSRCINKQVRFFLSEAVNGKMELTGLIVRVGDNSVYIDIEGEIIELPLFKINRAKQAIEGI